MRLLIAGNWKMHGTSVDLGEIAEVGTGLAYAGGGDLAHAAAETDVVLCVPATLLSRAASVAGERLQLGGETCHAVRAGAYTGEISAEMLLDAGAGWVILGHSERRRFHGETDAAVANKVKAAVRAGLSAIVCIGESEFQRSEGKAIETCRRQIVTSLPDLPTMRPAAIAYEPIWSIGTGHRPSVTEIGEMHAALREMLVAHLGEAGRDVRILYGGSVDQEIAAELLAIDGVDGLLVGGASLKAREFLSIIAAAHTAVEQAELIAGE